MNKNGMELMNVKNNSIKEIKIVLYMRAMWIGRDGNHEMGEWIDGGGNTLDRREEGLNPLMWKNNLT